MSVEKPVLEELIGLCESESEKRKWFEGAAVVLKGLKGIKREREQAERTRDEAVTQRHAALAEITAKWATHKRDVDAALVDLARVIKEKTDASDQAREQAASELTALKAQTVQVRDTKALEQGQLDAFRAEAKRETTAITARLEGLRAEERALRERFGSVAAALKE